MFERYYFVVDQKGLLSSKNQDAFLIPPAGIEKRFRSSDISMRMSKRLLASKKSIIFSAK